jgi:hypothetical protein
MASLGNMGDLLKRHYEKLLLAVALIALIGAVFVLQTNKSAEEEKIQDYERNVGRRKTKGVPLANMEHLKQALSNATTTPDFQFGLPHNLFNPVKWQVTADGTVIKIEQGTEVGPTALRITKIEPLQTIITLDRSVGSGLYMSVTLEAHTNAAWRRRFQSYVTPNSSHNTRFFTLREIGGTPENPQALIELASGDRIGVSANMPFTRIEGYKADLIYPPDDNRSLPNVHVGDPLSLAGEDYIVVAINPNEVVVSARSNNRRTTIRNNASP